MSEVKVNKISPRSGTTVTLGDSGDTISIPSGVTLANSGTFTNFQSTGIDDNATSTAITIDSSENVGIGTTSPTPPTAYGGLHINSQYPVLKLSSTTSGTGVADGFTIRINSADDAQLWHYENKNMTFATNNAERMRIDSSGNVGIKNTTMASFSNLPATDLVVGGGSTNSGITIYSGNTSASNIGFADGASGDARNQGIIQYHHNGDYMRFFTSAAERMRILSDGKVGIGTSSPAGVVGTDNVLEIAGASNPGLVINDTGQAEKYAFHALATKLNMYYGSTTFFAYDASNSKLGIHTDNPLASLHVDTSNSALSPSAFANDLFVENSGNAGITIGSGSSSKASLYFGNSSDNDIHRIETSMADGSMRIHVNASERMRIDSSGHAIIPAGVTLGTSAGTYNASNTLDDYEEGTWTPTAYTGVTSFSLNQRTYTKIGRVVTVYAQLTGLSGKSATQLQIGGLPFTPDSDSLYHLGVIESDSGSVGISRTSAATGRVIFYRSDGSSSSSRISYTGNDLGGGLRFSLTYFAD